MCNFGIIFALLLTLLLDGFDRSDALFAPTHDSRSVSKTKMALIASATKHGSRALQSAGQKNDDIEERNFLQTFKQSAAHLVEPIKSIKSSVGEFFLTLILRYNRWKHKRHLNKEWSKASSFNDEFMERLARSGHSPLEVDLKMLQNAAMDMKKSPAETFNGYIDLYLKKLGNGKMDSKGVIESFEAPAKGFDGWKGLRAKMIVNAGEIIKRDPSPQNLIKNNISPYMYAKVLASNTRVKSPKKGAFIPDEDSFKLYNDYYITQLKSKMVPV